MHTTFFISCVILLVLLLIWAIAYPWIVLIAFAILCVFACLMT